MKDCYNPQQQYHKTGWVVLSLIIYDLQLLEIMIIICSNNPNNPNKILEFSEFFENPEAFAMDRYMYVQCFKCNKAYFGGESRCQQVTVFCQRFLLAIFFILLLCLL